MPKHDAVERLMALATEKRADRVPPASAPQTPVLAPPAAEVSSPELMAPLPGSAAGDRGRRFLRAIQPMLPAVAGAMRLVDHGAVQAVARLLPLLGGSLGAAVMGAAPPSPASEQQQASTRELSALQASAQGLRRDLDALVLQASATEDELRRSRTHLERLTAELDGKTGEIRAVVDRSRMLAAASIILFMLLVAQMILLVVMFHK